MPHQTVLLTRHPVDILATNNAEETVNSAIVTFKPDLPVVLVREVQQPAGNTTFLKDIKQTEALSFSEAIILRAMDDQSRSAELQDVLRCRRVPAAVVVTVGPKGAIELEIVRQLLRKPRV